MKFDTKSLARAGLIAALYFVLTILPGKLATEPFFQIRPGEALTLFPIFMPEAIVGLVVGCAVINGISSTLVDVVIGSTITLLAGILSRIIYKKTKIVWLAGIPPVILNAVGLPIMFYLLDYGMAYETIFVSILLSQTVWVYGLGIPLFFVVRNLAKSNENFLGERATKEILYSLKNKSN